MKPSAAARVAGCQISFSWLPVRFHGMFIFDGRFVNIHAATNNAYFQRQRTLSRFVGKAFQMLLVFVESEEGDTVFRSQIRLPGAMKLSDHPEEASRTTVV